MGKHLREYKRTVTYNILNINLFGLLLSITFSRTIKRICKCCGIEFKIKRKDQFYCNNNCSARHRMRRFKNPNRENGISFVDKRLKTNYF